MKITVRVKPNSRTNDVTLSDDGKYILRVSVPAIEGKANKKVIEILAEYFHKPKRNISILSGFRGKDKVIEIL